MKYRHTFMLAVCLLIGPIGQVHAEQPEHMQQWQSLIEHVRTDAALDEDQRRAMVQMIENYDAELRDPQTSHPSLAADAAVEVLAVGYPALDDALVALGDEQPDRAIAKLKPLTAFEDPYLATMARYLTARALVVKLDFETAKPILQELIDDDSAALFQRGPAKFYLGVAQAHTLERDKASDTLSQFLDEHPAEAERLRAGASHILNDLKAIADGELTDVRDRMQYAYRRLNLHDTSKPTQEQHEKIVEILDALIEEQENEENQNNGGGGGGGGSQGPSGGQGGQPQGGANAPANQSTAPAGEGSYGEMHSVEQVRDQWQTHREQEREDIDTDMQDRVPEEYRTLVEQYFQSMQEEE